MIIKCVSCGSLDVDKQPIPIGINLEVKFYAVCNSCGRQHFFNRRGVLV